MLTGALVVMNLFVSAQDSSRPKNLSFLISPAILSSYNSIFGLQTAIQYRFNNKWSGIAEIAFPMEKSERPKLVSEQYLRIGAEIKRYRNYETRSNKQYYSLQMNYAFRYFTGASDYYFYEKGLLDSVIFYDRTNIKTPILAIAVKIGREFLLGRQGMFDLFTGAGTRTIFTTYNNIENKKKGQRPQPKGFSYPAAYSYNRTLTRFHYTIGFRIGYFLK